MASNSPTPLAWGVLFDIPPWVGVEVRHLTFPFMEGMMVEQWKEKAPGSLAPHSIPQLEAVFSPMGLAWSPSCPPRRPSEGPEWRGKWKL